MNYIYDVLLNFTNPKRVYDFFEWELNDTIINIKKVPVIKVSKEMLLDIFNYKVKVDKSFLKTIEGLAIVYKQSKKKFKYLSILSDGAKSLGVSFNDNGIVEYRSSMLLDEEEEASFIADKLSVEKIDYKKLEEYKKDTFVTRKEEEEKDFLVKEINFLYDTNDLEKLKYLYIEYFDKKEDSIEQIHKELIDSLNDIDERHNILYNLLKLTCKK